MLLDSFRGKGGGHVLGRGQKGGSGRRRKGECCTYKLVVT